MNDDHNTSDDNTPILRILVGPPVTGEPSDADYVRYTDEFFAQRTINKASHD